MLVNKLRQSRFLNININSEFLSNLSNKYVKRVSVGEYLIERLTFKNVKIGFVTEYKKNSELIKPLSNVVDKNDDFDLVFNEYKLNALHSAKTYTDCTDNVGVLINTTESDYEDFTDVLCCTNPLLSICLYETNVDLKKTIDETVSIHPCFKAKHTVNSAQKFPGVLEYMLDLCEKKPTAPVHLNISANMCKEYIDLYELNGIENLSELQFLEKLYNNDNKESVMKTRTFVNNQSLLSPRIQQIMSKKYSNPLQNNMTTSKMEYSNPPLL